MTYSTQEAQADLLAAVAEAIGEAGTALAALGGAYEALDDDTADRLEAELFRPLQLAYGRAQRAYAAFADRAGLPGRAFETPVAGAPSQGVKAYLEAAAQSLEDADATLADLQDSMLPVDVGDPELRASLAEVRELLAVLPDRTRGFVRVFGR